MNLSDLVFSFSTSFFRKWYSWKVAVWFQGHWLGVIDRTVSNFCLTQLYCSEQGLTQTVLKAESKTRRHLHWIMVFGLEGCAVIFASNGCKRCKHSSLVYLQVLLHFASYSCFPLDRTENLTEDGANSFIIIEGPRSFLTNEFHDSTQISFLQNIWLAVKGRKSCRTMTEDTAAL